MADNTHIIHRVNLEIEVPEMRLAYQVREDAVRIIYNDILPKLEKYLDSLVPFEEQVQLNQMNIKLENLSAENIEKEFTRSLLQVFQEKTEKLVEPSPLQKDQPDDVEVIKYTNKELIVESFLFFLETGRLPWWSEKSGDLMHEENLSDALGNSSAEFRDRLISLLCEDAFALERLLNQYSLQFILQSIFQHSFASPEIQKRFVKEELPERIERLLQKFESTANTTFPDAEDQPEIKFRFNELRLKIKSSLLDNRQITVFPEKEFVAVNTQKKISKKAKKAEYQDDGIFLDNAGLVLLHPFFDSLFTDFELLAEGQFKDSESQTLAVHLLHYLATKKELAAEYELGMEMFLCGWGPDLPIAREVTLSQEMKDESETLLKAAIKHWSALKNTSPDGLREGFLQREGKLILNDFQDRLIVESKAQDALLSYLPWGYSIFKLQWMESALYVEWL